MKYILIGILMVLVATSCYEDLGNYDYGNKTSIQVDSIKNLYEAYSGDTLRIVPQISSYSDVVSYEWSIYDSLQPTGEVTVLSNEKDLSYPVYLPQGIYQLEYKVTDADGYTQITSTVLSVITTYSEGFYVLKEIESNSDLDLYPSSTDPVPDLILNIEGKRMQGLPVDLFVSPNHKYIDSTNTAQTKSVLFPITEEETRMMQIEDMTTIFNYEDFFYELPEEKEQPTFFVYGTFGRILLTERNAYTYNLSGPSSSGKYSDHAAYINGNTGMEPAPYIAMRNMERNATFYDNLNGQFLLINGSFNTLSQFRNAAPDGETRPVPPFGLNCRMVYMRQPKSTANPYAIMENTDNGERYIFTLDNYYLGSNTRNPIAQVDTLPQDLHIYQAENFTVSENSFYIFYNVGSQLYSYNIDLNRESAVNLDLGGEEICMIDYLFWRRDPQWAKFIVGTFDGENYKIYLFDTRSDLPDATVTPTVYEGTGKPKAIHYVSPYAVQTTQYPYNG